MQFGTFRPFLNPQKCMEGWKALPNLEYCRVTAELSEDEVMKILLATISPRRSALTGPAATLLQDYIARSGRYSPVEHRVFASEDGLLRFLEQAAGRTRPALLVADSRGKQLSSEEFARDLERMRDSGTQSLVLGIGPADGWSAAALGRADLTLAFGRITLPHELAAVVAAEQIYRALSILAGHPYHSGH